MAPLTDWREIHLDFDRPLRVPDKARELMVLRFTGISTEHLASPDWALAMASVRA